MKKFTVISLIVGLALVLAWQYRTHRTNTVTSHEEHARGPQKPPPVNHITPPGAPKIPSASAKKATTRETEKANLALMLMTTVHYAMKVNSLNDLISYLEKSGLKPQLVEDKNEYTGSMYVVRTQNPLPGTRYFHAQYFLDEAGQKYAQHMSFEFKPGPNAFNDALETIKKTFPQLTQPSEQRSDFIQWLLPNGYVIWMKKMSARDLDETIFNAYTDKDIGTIRIAIEENPHDHAEGDNHHH